MRNKKLLILAAMVAVPLLSASQASAQAAPQAAPPAPVQGPPGPAPKFPYAKAPAANDPNKANFPDPTHIPFMLPENIPWTGEAGKEQQYLVWGDTRKPGPYMLLLKWYPGNYSKPHFHDKPRYIMVVSGTWWASSSNKYDPTKTYPLPVGTIVSDIENTVHWDGAKNEPAVLLIVGEGPVPNVNVDENGKPIPRTNF